MPFAGYKDFDACVRAQVAKGKSEEDAKKICAEKNNPNRQQYHQFSQAEFFVLFSTSACLIFAGPKVWKL